MSQEVDTFFRALKHLASVASLLGLLIVTTAYNSLNISFSFLLGALLGWINLLSLKEDGKNFLHKVYLNVMLCHDRPYQKERTLFLIKVFLRLLALALVFYFLIALLKLHPVFILIGFSLVYLQIFFLVLIYTLRKKQIC